MGFPWINPSLFVPSFCFATSIVTGRPSTTNVPDLLTAVAASSASAKCTNPNPLLFPPSPFFSATMNASFTGPISEKASSRPLSPHEYGRFRTNTVVGPPMATGDGGRERARRGALETRRRRSRVLVSPTSHPLNNSAPSVVVEYARFVL